jgi:hypothetical protein
MGDEGALGDEALVEIVEAFDLEAGELGLDAFGQRDVGDEAAAVDADQVAREGQNVGCHRLTSRDGGASLRGQELNRMTVAYIDPRSGATFPIELPRWCGDDHAPLMITPMRGISRSQIDRGERSLWRYRAAFPVSVERPISMGEGCTPLITKRIAGEDVLLKCEWFMPTGSFKDRGASVMLSVLRQQGITEVLEDSSGNGGAAVSCYAAAGGCGRRSWRPSRPARPRRCRCGRMGRRWS